MTHPTGFDFGFDGLRLRRSKDATRAPKGECLVSVLPTCAAWSHHASPSSHFAYTLSISSLGSKGLKAQGNSCPHDTPSTQSPLQSSCGSLFRTMSGPASSMMRQSGSKALDVAFQKFCPDRSVAACTTAVDGTSQVAKFPGLHMH